jgi:hypothetical protein
LQYVDLFLFAYSPEAKWAGGGGERERRRGAEGKHFATRDNGAPAFARCEMDAALNLPYGGTISSSLFFPFLFSFSARFPGGKNPPRGRRFVTSIHN